MNASKGPRKKKHSIRKWIIRLIILLLIAGGAYYAYTNLKAQYTTTYDEYTASIGTISNSLSFSGNLNLVDSATYTASASATVRKVYVAVGDEVKDGDKLIRLSNGSTIEAEFDGRVNTLDVKEGDEVIAGDTLIQVADFTHLRVSFRVDEYDISEISVGQACTVTATALEKSYDATIDSIDYIASGGNVAYYTAVTYVDVDSNVLPGMQVTVTVPQEEAKDVVVLKMDALSFDEKNNAYVLMKNESGEMEKVSVEVGVSNGNYVEIKSGLNDGDTVYVEAKVEETSSGVGSLFSGMFGSTQINQQPSFGGGGSFTPPGDFGGGSGNFGPPSGSSGSSRSGSSGGGMPGGNR